MTSGLAITMLSVALAAMVFTFSKKIRTDSGIRLLIMIRMGIFVSGYILLKMSYYNLRLIKKLMPHMIMMMSMTIMVMKFVALNIDWIMR